ncbi:MAG: CDP-alcohol phosphatidyltransferase family protein [Actinomycetota bacterium]|nr:CDP-alcohol phosphatidyltransferase family protein [Actinomycetota bacterium]
MGDAGTGGLDRVLTVPNGLSVARVVLLGLFCFLLLGTGDRVAAAAVLAVAGATDFLDGYVARHFDQVTTVGKVLDPTVDRVVLGASVVSLAVYGAIPVWLAAVVLGREALVSSTVLVLASTGARRIDVLWIGKAGTFGLMVSLPLFLAGHGPGGLARVVADATWAVALPALGASLGSLAAYAPLARRALIGPPATEVGSTA